MSYRRLMTSRNSRRLEESNVSCAKRSEAMHDKTNEERKIYIIITCCHIHLILFVCLFRFVVLCAWAMAFSHRTAFVPTPTSSFLYVRVVYTRSFGQCRQDVSLSFNACLSSFFPSPSSSSSPTFSFMVAVVSSQFRFYVSHKWKLNACSITESDTRHNSSRDNGRHERTD